MTTGAIITSAPTNRHAVVVEDRAGYIQATLGRGQSVQHLVVYDGRDLVIREGDVLPDEPVRASRVVRWLAGLQMMLVRLGL